MSDNNSSKKLKVLMIHNTLAVYRLPFFIELGKIVDLTVMFYDLNLNNKIYKDIDRTEILVNNAIKVHKTLDSSVMKKAYQEEYDFVILPPMDDWNSIKINYKFLFKKNVKKAIWWGRWNGPNIKLFSKRWLKSTIQKKVSIPVFKRIDIFLSYGTKSKEYLINQGVAPTKIFSFINATTVYPSVEKIDIREKYQIESGKKIVLYLGRIIRRKGVEILLDAFQNLPQSQYHLLLCGTGDDLDILSKKYESTSITFIGYIKPEIRSEFYSQSDIFVLPSYFENGNPEPWGLTVNEALQFKLPVVVTTAVGAAYDLIDNGINGVIVEDNDVDALEKGILSASLIIKENLPSLKYSPIMMAKNVKKAIKKGI